MAARILGAMNSLDDRGNRLVHSRGDELHIALENPVGGMIFQPTWGWTGELTPLRGHEQDVRTHVRMDRYRD